MSSTQVKVGDPIQLSMNLTDGNSGKFIQAVLRNAAETALGSSPVTLTHVADGRYANASVNMPDTQEVTATYYIYDDAGFTILSQSYVQRKEDKFYRNEDNALLQTIDGKVDVIDGNVDDIETLSNTIDGKIDTVDANVDTSLVNQGNIETKIDTVDSNVDTALVNQANIEGKIDTIDANVDQLLLDVASVASAIAALNDPSVSEIADAVWDEALSAHQTAGSTGEALENADAVADAAVIADAVWDEALSGHTSAGSAGKALADVDSNVQTSLTNQATIEGKVDNVDSDIANLNDLSQSDILSDATPFPGANIDAAISSRESESSASTRAGTNQTEHDATQSAIAALPTPPSVGDIADQVWDEALSGHVTSGSTGKALADIDANVGTVVSDLTTIEGKIDVVDGNVDDIETAVGNLNNLSASEVEAAVWGADLSSYTTVGTAGKILSDIDITSLESKIDTIDSNVDSLVSSITGIDSQLDDIEGKIDIVDGNVDTILTVVQAIDSNVDQIVGEASSNLALSGELFEDELLSGILLEDSTLEGDTE